MPLSNRLFDTQIEQFLKDNPQNKYLDVGCGAGKYGKMIKGLYPKAYVLGIEAESKHIEKYGTKDIYDDLLNDRIENFIRSNPSFQSDIVILGNVIEHLFKSDGVDLIHYLMYRTKFMVITFPSKFVMYDYKGWATESHNSVWTKEDFTGFDFEHFKEQHENLVIIKGYLGDPEAIFNLDK